MTQMLLSLLRVAHQCCRALGVGLEIWVVTGTLPEPPSCGGCDVRGEHSHTPEYWAVPPVSSQPCHAERCNPSLFDCILWEFLGIPVKVT